jgi:hypothetical protein
MNGFDPNSIPEDGEIDISIPHPSPDELGVLSIHDPNFIEQLDRRAADDSGSIPWSVLKNEDADS